MHNIRTNFRRFYKICKEIFEQEVDKDKNFQFYPVKPKMNDLEIISLSCCMEALGIDPENLLWTKLKTYYSTLFSNLIDRTRFNRRRKRLKDCILRLQKHASGRLENLKPGHGYRQYPGTSDQNGQRKKTYGFS